MEGGGTKLLLLIYPVARSLHEVRYGMGGSFLHARNGSALYHQSVWSFDCLAQCGYLIVLTVGLNVVN